MSGCLRAGAREVQTIGTDRREDAGLFVDSGAMGFHGFCFLPGRLRKVEVGMRFRSGAGLPLEQPSVLAKACIWKPAIGMEWG